MDSVLRNRIETLVKELQDDEGCVSLMDTDMDLGWTAEEAGLEEGEFQEIGAYLFQCVDGAVKIWTGPREDPEQGLCVTLDEYEDLLRSHKASEMDVEVLEDTLKLALENSY